MYRSGVLYTPSFANVAYAPAISNGLIPVSKPPNAKFKLSSTSVKVVIPNLLINLIDSAGVSSSIIFTNGIFCDDSTALLTVISP